MQVHVQNTKRQLTIDETREQIGARQDQNKTKRKKQQQHITKHLSHRRPYLENVFF